MFVEVKSLWENITDHITPCKGQIDLNQVDKGKCSDLLLYMIILMEKI